MRAEYFLFILYPKESRISNAPFITSRSLVDPITIPTFISFIMICLVIQKNMSARSLRALAHTAVISLFLRFRARRPRPSPQAHSVSPDVSNPDAATAESEKNRYVRYKPVNFHAQNYKIISILPKSEPLLSLNCLLTRFN